MNRMNSTITLQPIGASERDVTLELSSAGVEIQAGCFTGNPGDLRLQLEHAYQRFYNGKRVNGETGQYEACGSDIKLLRQYKAEYMALADFAEALQTIWTRKRNATKTKRKAVRRSR